MQKSARTLNNPLPPRFHPEFDDREIQLLEKIVMLQELKRKGLSISAIALRMGLDRKTVHKHLDRGLAAFIRYCETNADRMRCDLYRARGLPVGSGVVESACKHIVGNRFKKAGCRWSKAGANAPFAVRCCLENMRWPDFLEWKACRAAAA